MQAAWNTFLPVLVFIENGKSKLAGNLASGGFGECGEGSWNQTMNDGIDVYTVVGAVMIFLLLMGDGYGIAPMAIFGSVTGLFLGASGAALIPGILLLLLVGSFAVSSNFGVKDLAALGVVIMFIILVV